jgi:ATP-dependent RNA helicase RhlE
MFVDAVWLDIPALPAHLGRVPALSQSREALTTPCRDALHFEIPSATTWLSRPRVGPTATTERARRGPIANSGSSAADCIGPFLATAVPHARLDETGKANRPRRFRRAFDRTERKLILTRSFAELALTAPILRALDAEGYSTPTPIQDQAIPHVLAGRDLLGVAQTGTGKTAAFALPILQRLSLAKVKAGPRTTCALVLTPTRELAIQINDSFRAYGRHLGLRHAVIFGGVGQTPQVEALGRGIEILVATPGRLLDLMNQGYVKFDRLSVFVLDEADRMLDMGFIHDVRKVIAALPKQRQTLFFSATMPPDIVRLADSILSDPAKVEVTPPATTVERIEQRVYFVDAASKRALLAEVLKDPTLARVIVFTRTKHGANRVAEHLEKVGIGAAAIHGNKSQTARQRALEDFRAGRTRVLVATDIAARGIDIDGITHVINFELPNVPESYVHRIGRTARAGADGIALSFCDAEERAYLRDIEKLIRHRLTVVEAPEGFRAAAAAATTAAPVVAIQSSRRGGGGGGANAQQQPQERRQPRRRPRRRRAA